MTGAVMTAIGEALQDEALREREPCQHVAPVSRCVYDSAWWLCECGMVGCGGIGWSSGRLATAPRRTNAPVGTLRS